LFILMWNLSVRLKDTGLHHPVLLRQDLASSAGVGVISWTDGPSFDRVERALAGLPRTGSGTGGRCLSVHLRREYSSSAMDEARKALRGSGVLPGDDLASLLARTDFYSSSQALTVARYAPKEVVGNE